ncbi:PRC-barrel domain-containing protein [Pseudoroseomonas cervicalis]
MLRPPPARAPAWLLAGLVLLAAGLCAGPSPPPWPARRARRQPAEPPWRATRLLGSELHDSAARRLGTVVELLFDAEGRLTALVVGLGGVLGVGTRYVTVPWRAVRLEVAAADVPRPVYTGPAESLVDAPRFATEEAPAR